MAESPPAGKSALITGASSGIGQATAHALARDGANVALSARCEEKLTDVAETVESEYGVETLVAPADVRDEDGVAVTVVNPTEVRTEFGSVYGESFEVRFDEGEVTESEKIADVIAFAVGWRTRPSANSTSTDATRSPISSYRTASAIFSMGCGGSSPRQSPTCVRQDAPGATTSSPSLSAIWSNRIEPIARLIE